MVVDGAKSLLPDFVIKQGMVNPCLTRGADFEAYTGSMQVDPNADTGRYIVNMIGSSTVQDLQGDIMLMSALDDMTKVPDNLTILLNHSQEIPDSIFGGLSSPPWIKSSSGIADLYLSAEVEQSNPKAMQTYSMISRGRRLGCSIGCMVLDYDIDQKNQVVLISRVLPVEWSVVSVPANTRCWVEVATKSLFERSLLEGQADKALQLAPAVRGMYWRSYDSIVKHVEVTSLRNDLERVRPRDTADHRIMCVFNDGEINFELSDTKGIKKSLSREEVAGLLTQKHVEHKPVIDAEVTIDAKELTQTITPDQEEIIRVTNADAEDLDTKSVSGNTSFPLMDIGTEWDGSKAESQIFAYAKGDDGEINVAKAKSCFLWYDSDNSDKQSGYKLPFVFVSGGSPKIVPLGVRAVAGALQGARGGAQLGGDDAGVKAKVKTLYGRINSQFKPDPAWQVPWEKDDKAVEDEMLTTKAKEKDGIADSDSDSALNRQDTEEKPADDSKDDKEYPKASDVKVSADGTHEACKGVHEHSHTAQNSQGSDSQHSHRHEHNGDADHDHPHSEKATEPETTKAQDEVPTPETPTIETVVPEIDTKKQSLLAIYNSLGAELGFKEVTLEEKKSLIPTVDGVAAQDIVTAVSQLDACADFLMQAFGVPDIDEPLGASGNSDEEIADYQTFPRFNSLDVLFDKMLNNLATKSGKEISAVNQVKLKAMHDMIKSMHPDVCSVTVDEATDEARQQGEGQPIQQYPSMQGDTLNNSISAIENLTKSLESITVKSIVKTEVDAALDEAQKSLKQLRDEQRMLIDNMRKLKEMPLGRPTTMIGRTVVEQEGVTTFDELKAAGVNLLEVPVNELEDAWIEGSGGRIRAKKWPAGYRKGNRPALTQMQKTFLNPLMYYAYDQALQDVIVPYDEMVETK